MPRLLAISDLHLGYRHNREALSELPEYPDDWLILAGDAGESAEHLRLALGELTRRFARVIWVPGNHELWCPATELTRTRGQARYDELIAICRDHSVVSPEDPYLPWPAEPDTFLVPMFLLYDYGFRPASVSRAEAIEWAKASGVLCGDERLLDFRPWPSRDAWCHARVAATESRLAALPATARTILISHWPLRYDLARPPRVPRFSIWCGTPLTEEWGVRFRAKVVISGHLHFRTTLWRHGVRYEEVSLGYPRDWRRERGIAWYLREILPGTGPDANRFVPARDPFRHGHEGRDLAI